MPWFEVLKGPASVETIDVTLERSHSEQCSDNLAARAPSSSKTSMIDGMAAATRVLLGMKVQALVCGVPLLARLHELLYSIGSACCECTRLQRCLQARNAESA